MGRKIWTGLFLIASSSASAAAEPGIFYKVLSSGTYLTVDAGDIQIKPTILSHARLGLKPYDYVGLRRKGAFKAGFSFGDDITTMDAVFYSSKRYVAPADFGQQQAEVTLKSDIPEDFMVPSKTVIARLPRGSAAAAFTTNDAYFSDNTDPNGNYGVVVTYPNSLPPGSDAAAPGFAHAPDLPLHLLLAALKRPGSRAAPSLINYVVPAGQTFAGRFKPAPPVPQPQLRGYYRAGSSNTGVWVPKYSTFGGRPGGKHKGADIFAPKGTPVLAAVAGLSRSLAISGYGKVAAIEFKVNGRIHWVTYAHLDRQALPDNTRVAKGAIIGYSGCSGNASAEACGRDLMPSGGRTDHVHVGVYADTASLSESSTIDPLRFLGFTPKYR